MQTSAASACARHVVRVCHAAGFEPRVSFESDDYLTVQGLVAAGVGVALIPQLALSQTVSYDIAVRELQPDGPGPPCGRGDAGRRRVDCRPPRRCWTILARHARVGTGCERRDRPHLAAGAVA